MFPFVGLGTEIVFQFFRGFYLYVYSVLFCLKRIWTRHFLSVILEILLLQVFVVLFPLYRGFKVISDHYYPPKLLSQKQIEKLLESPIYGKSLFSGEKFWKTKILRLAKETKLVVGPSYFANYILFDSDLACTIDDTIYCKSKKVTRSILVSNINLIFIFSFVKILL
jgi:hypothetical protein